MTAHTHNFRCDDDLWIAAKEAATAEGRTATDVIVAALRRLVAVERRAGGSLACTHCGWVWNPANTSCEEHHWVAADAVLARARPLLDFTRHINAGLGGAER